MVKQIACRLFVGGVMALLGTPSWAVTSAVVDSNPVMTGETFNLTVRTTDDKASQPDFSALDSQFRVLNTVSGSEYRLVNGRASQSRHWTTTLVATQPGLFTIPSINVGAERTDPIEVQVLAATSGAGPRDAFVEFEADQADPYVRERVLLTVRLYVSGDLVSGQLGEPGADRAVMEQIGEQSESRAVRDGERYHLFERRYALFPEQAGALTIQPPQFTGELATGRRRSSMFNLGQFAGQTRKIYAEAEPISLTVRPPAADWQGPWIPASDVELVQTLVPDTGPFVAGEPFSRITELVVDGQLHTQIDPLRPQQPDGVQAYGDPPDATTQESSFDVQARVAQQWALIASRSGELTIPELRFRWWDTDDDIARETVIPARSIQVEPGAGRVASSPSPPSTPPVLTTPPGANHSMEQPPQYWRWLCVILGAGWVATIAAWAWTARSRRPRPVATRDSGSQHPRRDVLRALAQGDPARARQVLLAWGRQRHAPRPIHSLSEFARVEQDQDLIQQCQMLDAILFGASTNQTTWDPTELKRCIARLPDRQPSQPTDQLLPPLYPAT